MYKTFKYKEIEMEVKTTILNKGIVYFGEKDIQGTLEGEYNGLKYEFRDKTPAQFLLLLYKRLASKGIKADSLKIGSIRYTGIAMTELGTKQETLV